jgi:hypothetical protein
MILSFNCSDTARLFETGKAKRFTNIRAVAERTLQMLDSAATLTFCDHRQVTDWKPCRVTGQASTASASTINGEFVSPGRPTVRWLLKFWTTTESGFNHEKRHATGSSR